MNTLSEKMIGVTRKRSDLVGRSNKERSLKIAIYHNLEAGGAKRYLFDVLRSLKRKGYKIDLYTLRGKKDNVLSLDGFVDQSFVYDFKDIKHFSFPIYSVEQLIAFIRFVALIFRLEKISKRMAADIDRKNYDLVYIHHCHYAQTPLIIRFLKTRKLYCWHEGWRWSYEKGSSRIPEHLNSISFSSFLIHTCEALRGWFLKRLDRLNTIAADRITSNSYFSRETLQRLHGLSSDVVYPGIDVDKFKPNGQKRENFVFAPGRFEKNKGYHWIIKALGKIEKSKRPKLVMGGFMSEYYKKEVKALQDMAKEKEVMLEFVSLKDEELIAHYQKALCTVYLPYLEPFGLIPLESMACGTPVIGIREGGVRETVIDGEVGFLVGRDEDQVSAAISNLLENRELRERMGLASRKYSIENWNVNKRMEDVDALIRNLVFVQKNAPNKSSNGSPSL